MPITTKLSEKASFVVDDIADDVNNKNITVFYDDSEKTYGDNIMLVIYPPDAPDPLEIPMIYDEANKRYSVSIARSKDAGELFCITSAKDKGEPGATLQEGFISLKDGQLQPVNKILGAPEGRLQDFLLKANGEMKAGVGDADPKILEKGDRFIKIYTPPGYNIERKPPYNLQITLDGGQYLWPMQMDVVLDNLIASNEIEPVVAIFISPCSGPPDESKEGFGIVMPKGYPLSMRLKEYSCNPEYADSLASLPGILREQFNVTSSAKHTTIWGMSAGGLQAEYTALLHPEIFGNVVAQSPMAFNIPIQNGEAWRDGIVDKKDDHGDDITWSTCTAILPEIEGPHKEYITAALRSGYDQISGRDINPDGLPLSIYFDAGKEEEEYDAAQGSANLVKAAELLAEVLVDKGHTVIDECVHVIPGGHHNMTWMRNLADAARSVHSPSPMLRDEQTQHADWADVPATGPHISPEKFEREHGSVTDRPKGLMPASSASLTDDEVKATFDYLASLATKGSAGDHAAVSTSPKSEEVNDIDEPPSPSGPTKGSS